MATATAEAPTKKSAPKRKAASRPAGEPKPPRIPPFVNGDPFNEKIRVPLTREQFEGKADLMLEMLREESVLNSEYEAAKASFKSRIKAKGEEIAKVQAVMAARAEEQDVAVYLRYWPKRKIKQKYDARTNKPLANVKAVPMTSDDEKKLAQPDLLKVPATAPDASGSPEKEGHISNSVPGALENLGVPPGGQPHASNPQKIEEITFTNDGAGDANNGGAPASGGDDSNDNGDKEDDIPDHLQA